MGYSESGLAKVHMITELEEQLKETEEKLDRVDFITNQPHVLLRKKGKKFFLKKKDPSSTLEVELHSRDLFCVLDYLEKERDELKELIKSETEEIGKAGR